MIDYMTENMFMNSQNFLTVCLFVINAMGYWLPKSKQFAHNESLEYLVQHPESEKARSWLNSLRLQ